MRIWLVGKQANWRVASYSVLLDRVIGLVALASVGGRLPAVDTSHWCRIRSDAWPCWSIGLGSIGGGVVFLDPGLAAAAHPCSAGR